MPRTSTSNRQPGENAAATEGNVLQPVSNAIRNNAAKVDGGVDIVKSSAAARTPVFKMSTTRRQRRSNKRSGGQRLPSSNYLMQMGQSKGDDEELEDDQNAQENLAGGQREMLDPMLRGRRSGRKKPSNVGLDGEGFEDPSQFFKSPTASGFGGRLSTDVESTPGGYTDTERDVSLD